MFRVSYNNMLQKLIGRDINGALTHISGNATEKYTRIFNMLGDSIPSVDLKLGILGDGQFSDEIVEFVVTRETPSGKKSFLIYFVRSGDGIWRIEAM